MTSTIASRVRRLRAERRWTAQRLAEECARVGDATLTRLIITKIETGHRRTVTADELEVLAAAFGVPMESLIRDQEGEPALTVLHLSDLKIGPGGVFGRRAPADPGALGAALHRDLDALHEETGLRPDLVVVSGDVTAAAKPADVDAAAAVLTALLGHLGLAPERLVVVPGGHDVNRQLCHSVFLSCEADEIEPTPPYWQKWTHFARLGAAVQGGRPARFEPEYHPRVFAEFPDLRVVVCGLNSTIADSHRDEDHYGLVGDEQAAAFARELQPYEKQGWFRLGVVHHNVAGTAADDRANLRDAAAVDRLLGKTLNVLLHGRPGPAGKSVAYLDSGLPLLQAGTRPTASGAANEYQLLHITGDGMTRWARRYDGAAGAWEPATAPGRAGDDSWTDRVTHTWQHAHETFPMVSGPSLRPSPDAGAWSDAAGPHAVAPVDPRDDLLDRIAEICAVRYRDATVHRVAGDLPYLRVTALRGEADRADGLATQVVFGACVDGVDRDVVDRFRARVHRVPLGREGGPATILNLVHEGPAPDRGTRAYADRRGVRLRSFAEVQGLLDLSDYVARQTDRLEGDGNYPPRLYVRQRYHDRTTADPVAGDDVVERLLSLVTEPDGRFVLLLGDFGRGKTFALHEVARRIARELGHLTPILIDLRALDKAHTVDGLVAAHLATNGHDYIDVRALRYMLGRGRVVLLFDGFDELVARITYERAADHLETLLAAATGQAKIVVASRTQHFQTHQQVLSALGERVGLLPTRRVLALDEFSPAQIREHLVKRFDDEALADRRLELINAIPDLAGLVRNPRMLGFVLDLGVERLQSVTHASGTFSAAGLYAEVITQWLTFEENRTQGVPGAPVGLGVEELRLAVTRLAVRLWETAKPFLELSELLEVAAALEHLIDKPVTHQQAAHAVGAGSLLVRTEEGLFGFIHSSVMEWLVAGELARQVAGDEPPPLLRRGRLSQLTVDFATDLADPARAARWATAILAEEPPAPETARANAFGLLSRLRTPARTNLRDLSLSGENLSTRNFAGVDLSGADLTGTRLVEVDLTGAVLTGATLDRARLDHAVLDGADVSGASFAGARLLSTSLRDVRVSGGDWRHAVVVGAQADGGTLDELAGLGAAVTPRLPVRANLAPSAAGVPYGFEIGRYPQPVGYDPRGTTVAFGSDDGGLIVCDARSGQPLRTIDAHRSRTYFVAYSPDGAVIATGGADAAVRLWDSVTGDRLHELTGHGEWVWPVTFSADSRRLAAGGSDGVVRVWDTGTGELRRSLTGHGERVWAMGFTPDGDTLAVADDAGARLWDLPSSRVRAALGDSRKPVYVLACSPAGDVLVTGESTGAVRLWDPLDGRPLTDLAGHTAGIYAVAFRRDGGELVTGDRLGGVRLWERDSGWSGRALTEHRGAVYSVAFGAPDLIVTADSEGVVRLFRGGRLRHELTGHRASVWPVAVRPDGGQVATSGSDDSARLWNTATGAVEMHLRGHSRSVGSVGFTADGSTIAAASVDGAVRLWDVRTGALRTRLRDGDSILISATTSPTVARIATATPRGDIQLWNAADGELERKIAVETDGIWAEAFDHQGGSLAVAADDDTVQLFYPDTGRRYEIQQQHQGRVRSIAFTRDGETIATGCDDSVVRLWPHDREPALTAPDPVAVLAGHTDRVYSVAFDDSGDVVVSAGWDGTVRLWDRRTGAALRAIEAGAGRLWSCAVQPAGTLLAAGGDDGVVRLWDRVSGELVAELAGHTQRVLSLAFDPEGRVLAGGGDDGTVRLWSVPERALVATLVGLADGWAALTPDGSYKVGGDIADQVWHTVGMGRFPLGELVGHLPGLRHIPLDDTIWPDAGRDAEDAQP